MADGFYLNMHAVFITWTRTSFCQQFIILQRTLLIKLEALRLRNRRRLSLML